MSLFSKQMLEAALWTFIETFIVALGVSWAGLADLNWAGLGPAAASAALAGLAAVASLIKSFAVRNIGEPDTVFLSGKE